MEKPKKQRLRAPAASRIFQAKEPQTDGTLKSLLIDTEGASGITANLSGSKTENTGQKRKLVLFLCSFFIVRSWGNFIWKDGIFDWVIGSKGIESSIGSFRDVHGVLKCKRGIWIEKDSALRSTRCSRW